jgi:hypothetical protein
LVLSTEGRASTAIAFYFLDLPDQVIPKVKIRSMLLQDFAFPYLGNAKGGPTSRGTDYSASEDSRCIIQGNLW